MGQRGKAPAPLALKVLKGTGPGRDSGGKPLPVVPYMERDEPLCPTEVRDDTHALEAWDTWVPYLTSANVLRPIDFASLAMACLAYSHWRRVEVEMQEQIKQRGTEAYLTETREGTPVVNPLWRVRKDAEDALRRAMRECGLTPSSEAIAFGQKPDNKAPDSDSNPFA